MTICPAQMLEDTVIKMITLAGITDLDTDGLNVVRREMPERVDKDPLITCIVCVGKERMPSLATHERKTNTTNILDHPVLVVVTKKTAIPYYKSDPWMKQTRWDLYNLLFRNIMAWRSDWSNPSTTVLVTSRCVYVPEPAINTVGFQRDVKVSAQMFLYRTEQNRKA